MWHLTLRTLLAHRGRFALTLFADVLSVTFISGSLMLTDTSERLLEDQFRTASAGVDITIRDAAAFDSAMGVEVDRDPLPADTVRRVTAIDGVREVQPVVDGQGVLEVDGRAIVPTGASLLSSYSPEPFGAFTVRDGRAPENPGEVAIDVATARSAGIEPGDTVAVLTDSRTSLTVVGLVGFADQDGMTGATVALVQPAEAQRMLDVNGYSEILATVEDGTPAEAVIDELRTVLGETYAVASAQDSAAASASAAQEQIGSLSIRRERLGGPRDPACGPGQRQQGEVGRDHRGELRRAAPLLHQGAPDRRLEIVLIRTISSGRPGTTPRPNTGSTDYRRVSSWVRHSRPTRLDFTSTTPIGWTG